MTPNPSTPEATRAPFDMPLHRSEYGDDIRDNQGDLVIAIYGDEREKETILQRDYVVRAVNSYDDMLSALKANAGTFKRLAMHYHHAEKHSNQFSNCGFIECSNLALQLEQIDAAIAKAGAQ